MSMSIPLAFPFFRHNFIEMWYFVKLAPDKFLAISKSLTGASFGLGLSKVCARAVGVALLLLLRSRFHLINYTSSETSYIDSQQPSTTPYPLTQHPLDAC